MLSSFACANRSVSILETDIRDLQNRIYEMQKRQAENQVAIQELKEQLLGKNPTARSRSGGEGETGEAISPFQDPEVPGSTIDLGDEGPVRNVEPSGPAVPPAPPPEARTSMTPGPPSPDEPPVAGIPATDDLYTQGYSQFNMGSYQAAQQTFQEFLAQSPESDLADDAQYWVGECFLALKDYRRSVLEFRRVIDQYPFGNRVPHSFLKIGLAYLALGDKARAAENLETVVEAFPRSDVATVARATLNELQGKP